MSWDRGYYYRVRKINGRVVRQYVGGGLIGQLAAQMDELERQKREADKTAKQQAKADLEALHRSLDELTELADLAVRSALLAAGYRRHKRGEWRKQRVQNGPDRRTG